MQKQSYEQWGRDKGYSRDTTIISHARARVQIRWKIMKRGEKKESTVKKMLLL